MEGDLDHGTWMDNSHVGQGELIKIGQKSLLKLLSILRIHCSCRLHPNLAKSNPTLPTSYSFAEQVRENCLLSFFLFSINLFLLIKSIVLLLLFRSALYLPGFGWICCTSRVLFAHVCTSHVISDEVNWHGQQLSPTRSDVSYLLGGEKNKNISKVDSIKRVGRWSLNNELSPINEFLLLLLML